MRGRQKRTLALAIVGVSLCLLAGWYWLKSSSSLSKEDDTDYYGQYR